MLPSISSCFAWTHWTAAMRFTFRKFIPLILSIVVDWSMFDFRDDPLFFSNMSIGFVSAISYCMLHLSTLLIGGTDRTRTDTRIPSRNFKFLLSTIPSRSRYWKPWLDLNQRSQSCSLLPCHLATRPFIYGAWEESRTLNLLITSQLLCHLSYTGIKNGVSCFKENSMHHLSNNIEYDFTLRYYTHAGISFLL